MERNKRLIGINLSDYSLMIDTTNDQPCLVRAGENQRIHLLEKEFEKLENVPLKEQVEIAYLDYSTEKGAYYLQENPIWARTPVCNLYSAWVANG